MESVNGCPFKQCVLAAFLAANVSPRKRFSLELEVYMASFYKFIEATSVASLQEAVNKFVADNPEYRVINMTFAAGTGFVATLEAERPAEAEPRAA